MQSVVLTEVIETPVGTVREHTDVALPELLNAVADVAGELTFGLFTDVARTEVTLRLDHG